MAKEFYFYGKTLGEVKKMSLNEFIELIPSRRRRSIKRGFTEPQKILLNKIRKNANGKKIIKTHVKDIIVLPEMLEKTIAIHNGKEFINVIIIPEMLGMYLGELILTRKKIQHSAPGVGATKSSAAISVRG